MSQVNRNFAEVYTISREVYETMHNIMYHQVAAGQRARRYLSGLHTNTTKSGKNVKKPGFSLIAGENAKWHQHFEGQWEVSDKPKPFLRPPHSSHVPWDLYKGLENSSPTKS